MKRFAVHWILYHNIGKTFMAFRMNKNNFLHIYILAFKMALLKLVGKLSLFGENLEKIVKLLSCITFCLDKN